MRTNGTGGAHRPEQINGRGAKRSITPASLDVRQDDDYRVGPGRPPRESQFKPGQSGNPKGAKRKAPSITADLKALLEGELIKKTKPGDGSRIITMAEAGITELVKAFAEGDRFARRDLIALAKALGVDLTMGRGKAIENALAEAFTANDQALLDDYCRRHASQRVAAGNDSGSAH